jgi:hypothetical protein
MQISNSSTIYSVMPTNPNEVKVEESPVVKIEKSEASSNQDNNTKKEFKEDQELKEQQKTGGNIDIFV